jgi:hypothetical protein
MPMQTYSDFRVVICVPEGATSDDPAVAELREKLAISVPDIPIEVDDGTREYDMDGIEDHDVCLCAMPIVYVGGEWLHFHNPVVTGADDHPATPE